MVRGKYDYLDWSKPIGQLSEETGINYDTLYVYAYRHKIDIVKTNDYTLEYPLEKLPQNVFERDLKHLSQTRPDLVGVWLELRERRRAL
jgi:hypothetical protein